MRKKKVNVISVCTGVNSLACLQSRKETMAAKQKSCCELDDIELEGDLAF
jgi:hypothetical protein